MNYHTGLRRRSPEAYRRLLWTRPYRSSLLPVSTVFQSMPYVHDQCQKGSCVGQALTEGAERFFGSRMSAVDLWTDARRRQGNLLNADTGTDSIHAIDSFTDRGLSLYVDGEDSRPITQDIEIAALQSELQAPDHRLSGTAYHMAVTIGASAREQIVDGLQRGYACIFGTGVFDPYFDLKTDNIADRRCLGADDQGHEQRILGYIDANDARFPIAQRGCYVIQNSWGAAWGGYILPCDITTVDSTTFSFGTMLSGCVLATYDVIESTAWDCDVVQIIVAGAA